MTKLRHQNLRLRVFAGPNGSGKTTVIQSVRDLQINQRHIDFGTYVNADDIARLLRIDGVAFTKYGLDVCSIIWIEEIATRSGLLSGPFGMQQLRQSIAIEGDRLLLTESRFAEQVAQILADCFRVALLEKRAKFSFETVFSHSSKVEFMKTCANQGYKVYFYFVGTESPEINQYRVASRVNLGGHNVPPEKIEERYYRSMELMWEASQNCYQAFFFDNSVNDQPWNLFASFKVVDGHKSWHTLPIDQIPEWFLKYYVQKAQNHRNG